MSKVNNKNVREDCNNTSSLNIKEMLLFCRIHETFCSLQHKIWDASTIPSFTFP